MKKCLEILDFEDKATNAGKPYVRYKTNEGWMSCFDGKSNEALKALKGFSANCEVIESGEFKNIKKFFGPGSEEVSKEEITKKVGNGREKKEMYVSYAKDAFCAIVGRISQAKFDEMAEEEVLKLMDLSINAIKKAEKAF